MPFMAAAVPYIMAAAAAASAAAAYNAGQQQKKAAQYNAEQQTNAAHIAADTAGSNAISQQRSDQMQLGNAAALLAQSGTGFSGTGLEGLRQSAVNANLNEMNIQYGGSQSAIALNNQATLSTMQGNNAQTSGYLNAAGQLFSGAGGVYRYTQNPAITPNQG